MKLEQLFINGQLNGKQDLDSFGIIAGKIQYLGCSNSEKLGEMAISQGIKVTDFEGKSVFPGFIDAHMHLLMYAWKKHHEVDLRDVTSIESLITKVRRFIEDHHIEAGQWVIGSGWNQELFKDKRMPVRDDLDKISTTHPVLLNRACYHVCAVNSPVLALAGLSKVGRQIEGGHVDVDLKGIPTGILRENAISLAAEMMPEMTDKALMKSLIISGCHDLVKVGITTVHTDDFEYVANKETLLEAYMELAQSEALPIRVVLQLRVSGIEDVMLYKRLGLASWTDFGNLRIGPAKIIADGSLGSRTAALEAPYSDADGTKGILIYTKESLELLVKTCFEGGFDIAIHAIGDRTMAMVLDIYEKNKDIIDDQYFRPSIIHCQIASKAILENMKTMNIVANIQPIFLNTDWRTAESRVGSQRMVYSYCWKTYLDYGIHCAGSSDAPIEDFNPMFGIHCAVNRKDLQDQPTAGWYTEESLDLSQSIEMFTEEGAYASKEEAVKGFLDIGYVGDFIVLDKNPYDVDQSQLRHIQVKQTYVGGILVYDGCSNERDLDD